MYYWKTKQLVNEIKADTLTEATKKNYYIGSSTIILLGVYLAIIAGTDNIPVTLLEGSLTFAAMVLGINLTFKTNGGKDYITRVVMLSFPLLVKIYTAILFIGFILGVYAGINELQDTHLSPWLSIPVTVGVQLIYFWRLNTHLSEINA